MAERAETISQPAGLPNSDGPAAGNGHSEVPESDVAAALRNK
jgi:hypothetical protein